jgi:hypothetical protein
MTILRFLQPRRGAWARVWIASLRMLAALVIGLVVAPGVGATPAPTAPVTAVVARVTDMTGTLPCDQMVALDFGGSGASGQSQPEFWRPACC